MALKLINATNSERHEAKQVGKHLLAGRYYNADKTVERFINAFKNSDELIRFNPRSVINDPTVTGFKLFFNFAAEDGLLANEKSPNSALKYLKDIGDTKRYDLLKLFISRLSELNTEQPWVFQSIEGLREVFTNPWSAVSFFNSTNKLVISTYETLDLKVSSLNHLWRQIYYDKNRGVMVLPENLRSFGMSVYLLDMRVFNTKFKFLRNWETTSIAEITHQLFEFGNCQFLDESGGSFFDAVTNISIQENLSNFVIGYDVADYSILSPSMMGEETLSKSSLSFKEEIELVSTTISNEIKNFDISSTLKKFKENVKNNALEYGNSQAAYYTYQEYALSNARTYTKNLLGDIRGGVDDINQLFLGNVQGAGLANLANRL